MEKRSLITTMAHKYDMEPAAFQTTLQKTIMPGNVTNEQLASFLLVANEYNLNPFTKEIFAFPANGGIQPIVSVDGWMKMINAHPQFDGMTFKDHVGDNGIDSITVQIHRKDREHPIEVTEYMSAMASTYVTSQGCYSSSKVCVRIQWNYGARRSRALQEGRSSDRNKRIWRCRNESKDR